MEQENLSNEEMIQKLEELILQVDTLIADLSLTNNTDFLNKIPLLQFYNDDLRLVLKKYKEEK